jgi:hypothetical protein
VIKHPPTMGHSIDRIERCYDKLDEMLKGDIPPEIAIKAFQIEQRLDRLVERIEKDLAARDN